ncbi:MAG: hypothetical protein HDS35_00545 [Bacteroides sp.]|nr:hypothetical protein [Bacteroides sp.]
MRKKSTTLLPTHLNFFYSVLLIVENDDPTRYKGFDWKKFKDHFSHKVKIFNDSKKKKISIPENIGLNEIYFREYNQVAYNFLRYLRHAFAHNYIDYDSENDSINIELPYNRSDNIKLRAWLEYTLLEKMIDFLNEQKVNSKK